MFINMVRTILTYGAYVTRVASARQTLLTQANQSGQRAFNQQTLALQVLGKNITVPGLTSSTRELPGLSRTKAPAQSWLRFEDAVSGEVVAETSQDLLGIPTGTTIGKEERDLSDIQDVVLSMEYDVTPGAGA